MLIKITCSNNVMVMRWISCVNEFTNKVSFTLLNWSQLFKDESNELLLDQQINYVLEIYVDILKVSYLAFLQLRYT